MSLILRHGDCIEVMRYIERVDHVITDPPYEAEMQRLHASTKLRRLDAGPQRRALDFNSISKLREPFLDAVKQLNKGWLLAFCNVEGVGEWRAAILQRELKFKTTCIWNKPDATPKLNGQGPALGYECIVTAWCGPGYSRWNGGGKRGVFTHPTNGRERHGLHPAEKPVALMCELISLFTSPGDVVLDPFMGTGATGVACARMGRNFIGIEQKIEYYEVAVARINQAQNEPDFFRNPKRAPEPNLFRI